MDHNPIYNWYLKKEHPKDQTNSMYTGVLSELKNI